MTASSTARSTNHARLLGLANAAAGAVTVLAARRVAAVATRNGARPPRTAIVRVLGARQLVQGIATVAAPDATMLLGGAAVDILHALSMVPLVAFSARFRRPAAISAALASASAVSGAGIATSTTG